MTLLSHLELRSEGQVFAYYVGRVGTLGETFTYGPEQFVRRGTAVSNQQSKLPASRGLSASDLERYHSRTLEQTKGMM